MIKKIQNDAGVRVQFKAGQRTVGEPNPKPVVDENHNNQCCNSCSLYLMFNIPRLWEVVLTFDPGCVQMTASVRSALLW